MYFKHFTRLFLLMGMIGLMSVSAWAQERGETVTIGTADEFNYRLPFQAGNYYSLSEQIYTADEINNAGGGPGTIISLSFYGYNSWTTSPGERTWDIYLVNTTKSTFSSASDWVGVNSNQKVFSGTVTIKKDTWTVIPINNFDYQGENLLVVVDDNSGESISGYGGWVFNTTANQSLWAASQTGDINPSNPNMTCTTWEQKKNNIKFEIELASTSCPTPKNLVASNVSSNSAQLTWQAGGDETAWNLQYKTAASSVWSQNISVTGNPLHALTSLTPNTDYQARVQAACSGEESGWKTVSFTTECEAIDLPYYYDFSDAPLGSMPDCWHRINDATNSSYQNYPQVSSDQNHNTSPYRSMRFSYSSSITNQIAVLPVINVDDYPLNQYQVVFWSKLNSGTNRKLQVGTMTNPNDATTFRQIEEVTVLNTTWNEYTVRFDNYTYSNQEKYIAIKSPNTNATTSIYVDDITVQAIRDCEKPYSLTKSNEAAHGATIAWAGGGDNWQIAYSTTSNFDPDDLNQCSYLDVQSNPYTFTTLDPNTKYYIRIRTKCGENEYSYWSTTPTNFYIQTTIACPAPTGLTANNVTALSADISWIDNNANEWELAYSTTSTFTESTTTTVYPNTTFYTLGLNPDTRYYVKVRANCSATNDGYSNWTSYINFKTPERCVTPSNLHCASFTSNTASLEWTIGDANQNNFTIAYSTTSGFNPETALQKISSTNRVTLTRLTPETTYYAKVRANCGGEDGESNWSAQCSFKPSASGEIMVNNGTTTNNYVPVYGLYVDDYSKSQFIIPASSLAQIAGCQITNLKFHCKSSSINWGNARFEVYVTEVNTTEMQYTTVSWDGMTKVYSGALSVNNNVMEIQFNEPFTYQGGNLKIGINQIVEGTYMSCAWYGVTTSYYASVGGYTAAASSISGSNLNRYKFLPKTTITYTSPNSQIVELSQGWNWWSTNIEMSDMDGLALLEQSLGNNGLQIKSRDKYTEFDDGEWFGGLDDEQMTNEQMYMILTNADCLVELQGAPANPANHAITINHGWNWIGFPCSNDMSVDVAFSNFTPEEGDQLKSFGNYTEFDGGEWFGALQTMETGFGFMYYSNSYNTKTIIYQSNEAKSNRDDKENTIRHWTPVTIGDMTMTCTSVLVVDDEEQSNPQLEIGIFDDNGICRGSSLPKLRISTNRYIYSITIYGEMNYTYTCKVFDHTSGEELALTFVSNQDNPLTYEPNKRYGTPSNPYQITFANAISFTKPITAYTSDKDRYYLIASPIGTVSPEYVTNMLSNSFDLYRFNQSAAANDQGITLEWENYKQEGDNYHFNLEPGKGYLYANDHDVTLQFVGTPYNGDGKVTLNKTENVDWPGWNLVGNPFGTDAALNMPFIRLSEGAYNEVNTENQTVNVMEGVFVQATENGQNANFTPVRRGESTSIAKLNISVVASTSSSTALDNAIVRFDGGATLGKFQLNPNHTKVYIPQDGKDYAIVRSATQGELPLSFKAEKNGTYTLSFNSEEVTFSYLHLIDNMTGADVDLLAGASTLRQAQGSATYTFEAKTTDYASRFRLVFNSSNANEAVCEPSFAYFNGSNWTVSATGSGAATLQVIDMIGRVLSSETISGNTEININQPAGVYMLRLIDNENVRVQKVVVR